MPAAIIFALFILEANNVTVPTPIWVVAWILIVLIVFVAIEEARTKSSAKEQRKTIIALLTSIKGRK